MESQEISNLLNETSDSNFLTRKWSIVDGQSNKNCAVTNYL